MVALNHGYNVIITRIGGIATLWSGFALRRSYQIIRLTFGMQTLGRILMRPLFSMLLDCFPSVSQVSVRGHVRICLLPLSLPCCGGKLSCCDNETDLPSHFTTA